jgi:tRNA-2-methylthio-N6-dimethylallyladenosine synthase
VADQHLPDLIKAGKRTKKPAIKREFKLDPAFLSLGKGRRFFIKTHGCQANEADSEMIAGLLIMCGFTQVDILEDADFVIINTCAIRENAENKVYGEIGRLKDLKRSHKNVKLIMAGCMMQEESVVDRILKTFKHVDIVIGTHNIDKLPEMIASLDENHAQRIEVESGEGEVIEHIPVARSHRYKAWVNIIYGCDEFCTYCVVPYTRGKERSRQLDAIVDEVRNLAIEGYQEVTLLGQNVNAYGQDLGDAKVTFAELLRRLHELPIPRIRFTTSHPKDFSKELVDVLALGGNLMPYIHLPVQSGSNRILKAMNRKYTREQYLELVDYIYQKIPTVSLTTDIIVGFPQETENDFQETLSLVEEARFEGAYTFVYSPRPNTPAARLYDDVTQDEKKARLYRLNEVVNAGYKAGNVRFLNKIVDVLIEGKSKTDPNHFSGYTPNQKIVNLVAEESDLGRILPVKITKAMTWSLKGEIVR